MHDVACEFACAVGCAETISANVLKVIKHFFRVYIASSNARGWENSRKLRKPDIVEVLDEVRLDLLLKYKSV